MRERIIFFIKVVVIFKEIWGVKETFRSIGVQE
jgi:dienelactone hydrolase